jgi:hypothetical protein
MTKKCRDIELVLSAYLENELSKEEAASIAEHLGGCPDCSAMKEKMEEVVSRLSDLQEEVPFFLKNRLYNIPEIVVKRAPVKVFTFPKWLAAAVGTIVLFFNLFYFTNVFPPAHRELHSFVSSMEKIVVKAGGWFEKIKESKEMIFFTFFNKKSVEIKNSGRDQEMMSEKGGKNG